MEEHGSPTYKRLNVSSIVPIIKVSWQQCFQLFQELALSANPLDEWFCFCHFIFFVLIHSTISVRRSSAISTSRSFVVFVKRISKCIEFGTIKNCHTICFHSAKITDIIDADDISAVFYDISAIEKDGLNAWMNVIAILASKRLCQALFLIWTDLVHAFTGRTAKIASIFAKNCIDFCQKSYQSLAGIDLIFFYPDFYRHKRKATLYPERGTKGRLYSRNRLLFRLHLLHGKLSHLRLAVAAHEHRVDTLLQTACVEAQRTSGGHALRMELA